MRKRIWYETQAIYIMDEEDAAASVIPTKVGLVKKWYCTFDLNRVESYAMTLQDNGEPWPDQTTIILESGAEFIIAEAYSKFRNLMISTTKESE